MKQYKEVVVEDVYTIDELLSIYKNKYQEDYQLIGYRHQPPLMRGVLVMYPKEKWY